MAKYSINFGRRKIDNPSIHGKWMKPTSKLREVGIILYRAIDADGLTLDIWLRKETGYTEQPMLFLNGSSKQFGEAEGYSHR